MKELTLFEKECSSYTGERWNIKIYCKLIKEAAFELRIENSSGGSKVPHRFSPVKVSSPETFIDALTELDGWDEEELGTTLFEFRGNYLPNLYQLDPFFALAVLKEWECRELALEDVELPFEFLISVSRYTAKKVDTKKLGFPSGLIFDKQLNKFIKDFLHKYSTIPEGEHKIFGMKVFFCRPQDAGFTDKSIELSKSFDQCIYKPLDEYEFNGFRGDLENSITIKVMQYLDNFYLNNQKIPRGEHKIGNILVAFE